MDWVHENNDAAPVPAVSSDLKVVDTAVVQDAPVALVVGPTIANGKATGWVCVVDGGEDRVGPTGYGAIGVEYDSAASEPGPDRAVSVGIAGNVTWGLGGENASHVSYTIDGTPGRRLGPPRVLGRMATRAEPRTSGHEGDLSWTLRGV